MLSISHALTGAFISSKIQNPIISTPLILMSHYIEDWVLHWDVGTGLTNGSRKRRDALLLEVGDMLLAIVLIYLFFQTGKTFSFSIWYGAFVGLLPDFVEAPRNFLHWNPWFLKPFNAFHHKMHHSTPNMIQGLIPQIVVIGFIFLFR